MFILGYFLKAIAEVLDLVLVLFIFVVFARAVLSWVSPDLFNPIVRFIHNITEPVLHRIRIRLRLTFGTIDFSPILALLGAVFLRNFLVNSIRRLGETRL